MVAPADMNDLQAAWRALAGGRDGEGWRTVPIDSAAPCLLLAGRRLPRDEEAVLVGFQGIRAMPPDSGLPQGQGFEVSRLTSDPIGGNRIWFALARRAEGSLELFVMMTEDLVRLLEADTMQDSEDGLLRQFLSRIRAWQEFMGRHQYGVLPPEAELGLFGELVVVLQVIDAGMPALRALESWKGPLGGLQDFMLGSGGIEVKTTLSTGGFPATITSLEQLDDSLHQPIFLAAVRVALSPSGLTLPTMVDAMRERLSSSQDALALLEVRLMQAGFLQIAARHYSRRFAHATTAILPVRDNFPRLTRIYVHPAIRRVRYEIDLDLVEASDIGLVRALEMLGAA